MNIDMGDIKSFVTVAELKSISAAANKLNYLQSNMTAKIKKIENHYKRQLFIRKPKGVELTESGIDLYQQYKKMMFTWEETENKIYQQEKKLRFGTNTSLGGMRFYPSFKQLCETYLDISIIMKTGSTGFIEDEVLYGNIDIAYVLGHPNHKSLHYIHKAEDELVVIGKDLHRYQNINDALHKKNILYTSLDCCYWSMLDKLFQDFQIERGEQTHINDYESLVNFTQLGLGIAMVTKTVAKKYHIEHYLEIPKPYRDIGLYLIARNDHVFTPIEKQFIGLNDQL